MTVDVVVDRLARLERAGGVPFPSRRIARVERWTRLSTPIYSSGFHPFTLTGRGGGYTGRSEDGNSQEARRAFRWGMGLGLNRVVPVLEIKKQE